MVQSAPPAKSLIGLLFLLGALCVHGQAWFLPAHTNRPPHQFNLTIAWDASPDPTVTGYNAYDGPASLNYTNKIDAGDLTTLTISNLALGATYYFAVTAYDAAGLESLPSNEVEYTVPLPKTNIVLTVTGATELSPDLRQWAPNFEDPWIRTNPPGPMFFRGPQEPTIVLTHF